MRNSHVRSIQIPGLTVRKMGHGRSSLISLRVGPADEKRNPVGGSTKLNSQLNHRCPGVCGILERHALRITYELFL
jgi:hypothetical protein